MSIVKKQLGLYTDFYELTMAQGYFFHGKKDEPASFDYFFRTNPFKGGFTVFAGLQDFLELLSNFTFSKTDIEYLKKLGLKNEFLNYLKDFKFSGDIFSVNEGEIVFPNEPILRVEGNIIELTTSMGTRNMLIPSLIFIEGSIFFREHACFDIPVEQDSLHNFFFSPVFGRIARNKIV